MEDQVFFFILVLRLSWSVVGRGGLDVNIRYLFLMPYIR